MYPQKLSPREFSDKLTREWESWGKVIRDRKIMVR
jgi:hypothetical protein